MAYFPLRGRPPSVALSSSRGRPACGGRCGQPRTPSGHQRGGAGPWGAPAVRPPHAGAGPRRSCPSGAEQGQGGSGAERGRRLRAVRRRQRDVAGAAGRGAPQRPARPRSAGAQRHRRAAAAGGGRARAALAAAPLRLLPGEVPARPRLPPGPGLEGKEGQGSGAGELPTSAAEEAAVTPVARPGAVPAACSHLAPHPLACGGLASGLGDAAALGRRPGRARRRGVIAGGGRRRARVG